MHTFRSLFVILGVFFALCSANLAYACPTCAAPGPICEYFWNTPAILVGKVERIYQKKVHFSVEEVFRGEFGNDVVVKNGDSDCEVEFEVGKTYLLVLKKAESGIYPSPSICSGTQEVKDAKEELLYLHTLTLQPTRVFGEVDWDHEVKEDKEPDPAMSGFMHLQSAGRSVDVPIDKHGKFEITGIPPADYGVSFTLPEGFSYIADSKITLHPNGCVNLGVLARLGGSISGRVRSLSGRDLQFVIVVLINKNTGKQEYIDQTEDDGTYHTLLIEAGDYILGFRKSDSKTPVWYFPGVSEQSKAATITIHNGQDLKGFDVTIDEKMLAGVETQK